MKAVFFDLDGTLLPLREKEFINLYFGYLGKKFGSLGYDPEMIIKAVWKGTTAMRENNGEYTNEEVFWPVFESIVKGNHDFFQSTFLDFYTHDFDVVQQSTSPSKTPKEIIRILKQKGYRIILATNPLFPVIATQKRISWAGLNPSDFEWITTYETERFSKPNLKYYQSLLNRLGLLAEEVLMVGNDAHEDMISKQLGFETFLLTDCLNNEYQKDISVFDHGSMNDLLEYVRKMEDAQK